MRSSTWWLPSVLLLAACEGVIGNFQLPGDGTPGSGGGSNGAGGGSGSVYVPPDVSCDVTKYPGSTLEAAEALFVASVYPAMTEGASQCTSCHGASSGRRFTVSANATETFFQARSGGFFADDMGALLARVTNPDDRVRMPSGAPAWSDPTVLALAEVACRVRAFELNGGPAADEQFPPELLLPYTGPAVTSYDNPFVNFVQLKGKVKSVFNDTWVRGGVDQFERNIGLFGGVNYTTHFVEARVATPEFLLGLDALAPDVCGAAIDGGTGPFAGLNVTAPVIDVPAETTQQVEIETLTPQPATGAGNASTNPAGYFCYTNCTFASAYTVPAPGTYRVTVRARPTLDGNGDGPQLRIRIGAVDGSTTPEWRTANVYETKSVDIVVTSAGMNSVSINFFNDATINGGDRNIWLDWFSITGPLGPGTGTTRATAAKQQLSTLYSRMLYRPATAAEQDKAYLLLTDLTELGPLRSAWSGVCEALMRHPDFLFTMPPSQEKLAASPQREKLRLVGLTQRALGRPPTQAEFTQLGTVGFAGMIDPVFASADFRDYYFDRIRLRIEAQGTPESDEPARIWTYVTVNGRNFEEVLTAEYTVDTNFQQQPRPAEHGKTGLLTARGYLNNKPGLPHYNFPARVLSGFMGSVFEVPPEVFDQRGTATATSTVDPGSVCYSCHQLLTPLAHQRLRWSDDGTYLPGAIDDSDRELVATYPYKGVGLQAFTTKAVKKEPFVRRMLNTQVRLMLGRELRTHADERVLYKQLWDLAYANNGDLRPVLKALASSPNFQGAP